MEKKEPVQISLSTFFLIISIIVIIIMAFYIYTEKINYDKEVANLEANAANLQGKIDSISNTIISDSKNNNTQNITNSENVLNKLTLGSYTITEHIEDAAGVPYDATITLSENNLCSVYEGFGSSWIGTYKIENNKLFCNTVINRGESGGIHYEEKNIVFEFEILNQDEIKLVNVSEDPDNRFIALKQGMRYKLSNENIKVLVNDND